MSSINLKISLLFITSLFATTHGMFCYIYPCFYLQPPYSTVPKQSFYVYPTYAHQKPIVPIIIYVNKLLDQPSIDQATDKQSSDNFGYVLNKPTAGTVHPSERPQGAVQVLNPPSTGGYSLPIASTTSDLPTPSSYALAVTKPLDKKPSAPTSIPSFSATSASPSEGSSPNIPAFSENLNSVEPLEPTVPPSGESKQLDVTASSVIPLDTSGHRALQIWRHQWLQSVVTSTQPKLCQTDDPSRQISDVSHHQCLTTCEAIYYSKLHSIGLTATGVIFLGGSCQQEVQQYGCKCFVRLGMQYDNFSVTNQS